jgi:N-glycosidase YbiA
MAYADVEGESIDVNRPVLFYREDDEFGAFSNFSRHAVNIKGLHWPTTEHYFQVRV